MSDRDTRGEAWRVPPSAYLATRPTDYAVPAKPRSCYVAMRDGVRLAVDGSSGARTQGGCNGSAIAPTEDAASVQIRRRQTCAGGFEPAS